MIDRIGHLCVSGKDIYECWGHILIVAKTGNLRFSGNDIYGCRVRTFKVADRTSTIARTSMFTRSGGLDISGWQDRRSNVPDQNTNGSQFRTATVDRARHLLTSGQDIYGCLNKLQDVVMIRHQRLQDKTCVSQDRTFMAVRTGYTVYDSYDR
jgi:hypothetical protein